MPVRMHRQQCRAAKQPFLCTLRISNLSKRRQLHGVPRSLCHPSSPSTSRRLHASIGAEDGQGGGSPPAPPWPNTQADDQEPPDKRAALLRLLAQVLAVAGLCASVSVLSARRFAAGLGQYAEGPAVSIIVPALNEEKGIAAMLQHLRGLRPAPHEIIVVDGGSEDRTAAAAAGLADRVLLSERGRARQMNRGASAATGEYLCFVHADTLPPTQTVAAVRAVLQQPGTVLGGFRTVIEAGGRRLRFFTFHQFIKTYYVAALVRPLGFLRGIKCLFGDQTLFCRACDFAAVGGYAPQLPIMEDVDLIIRLHMAGPADQRSAPCQRGGRVWPAEDAQLGGKPTPRPQRSRWRRRRGRIAMVWLPASHTSGRRLASWGNLHATFVHFYIALHWYFGASPNRMRAIYQSMYTDKYR